MRTFEAFKVELDRQVLYGGEWGSDDCVWDWEIENHYFFSKGDALRYFKKQKGKVSPDVPLVRLVECTAEYEDGQYTYWDGDIIAEYSSVDSGVDIYWYDKEGR